MNKDTALSVKNIYKSFKLPHEQHSGIKQVLVNIFNHSKGYETQHVLKDINFDVKKGDFFGIVGRNGSGKSTLLKLISGIYAPDKGVAIVSGSLTPFIELGVGFNPELTGRENVFLNGALLGFSKKEMEGMYDEIVQFAEIEKFMDQKLKNYSSGMQVRLAFSIAIRSKSDVLILDEVLAVGDQAFQQKCYDYFETLQKERKTVILVTHDMSAVRKYCNRAAYLRNGKIIDIGSPKKIATLYDTENDEKIAENAQNQNSAKKILKSDLVITLKDHTGVSMSTFDYGQKLYVSLDWSHIGKMQSEVKNLGVAIFKGNDYIFGVNTLNIKTNLKSKKGQVVIDANLGRGKYKLVAGLFGETAEDSIVFNSEGPEFFIMQESSKSGDLGWEGLTKLTTEWVLDE